MEREGEERVIFASLNSTRQKEYRVGTVIKDSGKVIKFALDNGTDIDFMFSQILNNAENIKGRGLKTLPYKINEKNELEMDFVKLPFMKNLSGMRYPGEMRRRSGNYGTDYWQRSRHLLNAWSSRNAWFMNYRWMNTEGRDYGKILREGYVDMIPRNCFVKGKELLWFDQEWVLENIPSKFILYRGMVEMYKVIPEFEDVIPMMEFVKHYKMEECLEAFMALNELFLQMVANPYYVGVLLERVNKYIYRKNVLKLL